MTTYSATYDPSDNKLRLYASSRLDADTYARVKAAGFTWAPKQELFVAPAWTPEREDLLLDLAGEIEDEDKSLMERQEERADRFTDYKHNREHDADAARKAVDAIADNIPFGQPILVGHHSERHARRDAEKIENGMRKAIRLWDTAQYWQDRAKSALRHAKYKERPDVRARRIKKLEADLRKSQRSQQTSEMCLKLWTGKPLTHEQAVLIAGRTEAGHLTMPRKDGDRVDWDQSPSAYTGLSNSFPTLYAPRTVKEVVEVAKATYPRYIAHCQRWIDHYTNCIAYEKAMLGDSGGTASDRTGPEKGGGCQCWASPHGGWSWIVKVNKVSVTVWDNWGNGRDADGRNNFTRTIPFDKLAGVMTAAQVSEARIDGRLIETDDKKGFYLRERERPEPPPQPEPPEQPCINNSNECTPSPEPMQEKSPLPSQASLFDDMRTSLKAGVQTVTAPQLFPTPPDLADQIVRLAKIGDSDKVLEPSAGTGMLIDAIRRVTCKATIQAIEINYQLAERLMDMASSHTLVVCADFLTYDSATLDTFDRIVMNPPFENGADIKHIRHALTFLRPGGRLVAICANGPRQRDALWPIADQWIDLPANTFKQQGTGVNTAIVVIEKGERG